MILGSDIEMETRKDFGIGGCRVRILNPLKAIGWSLRQRMKIHYFTVEQFCRYNVDFMKSKISGIMMPTEHY